MARSFKPPARRRREVDTSKIDAGPQARGPGTRAAQVKEKLAWTGGELLVLEGGPRDRHWFTVADFKQHWDASRECGHSEADDPILRYRPSKPKRKHQNPIYAAQGTVWVYVPSLAGTVDDDRA